MEEEKQKFLPEDLYKIDQADLESFQQNVKDYIQNQEIEKEEVKEDVSNSADTSTFYSHFSQKLRSKKNNIPLIYSPKYNISFMGLEKLHPFDSCKYSKIVDFLKEAGFFKYHKLITVKEKPTNTHLLFVHTPEYIESLNNPLTVAQVTELFFIAMIPRFIVQKVVLDPFLFATSGSILAGHVSMTRGWAINLGGGFHHCRNSEGGGFCAYADITLCYRYLRHYYPQVKKVMIIDLDAHQGNGHENDKLYYDDNKLFILDMFNPNIYPRDHKALKAIDIKLHVKFGTEDQEYLAILKSGLETAFASFNPDFIVYNAGTDILDGDPLGGLRISPQGVIERDSMVFNYALSQKIPIVMLLSGGYQQTNARVIADSILNLNKTYHLINTLDSQSPFTEEPESICQHCAKPFRHSNNPKGECAHKKSWHSSFGDCSYLKCGFGLGPGNIGKQHWGCCYDTDQQNKTCKSSGPHEIK